MLLYRQERSQYDVTVEKHPGKSPSEIYGAEHLLRVFGKRIIAAQICVLYMLYNDACFIKVRSTVISTLGQKSLTFNNNLIFAATVHSGGFGFDCSRHWSSSYFDESSCLQRSFVAVAFCIIAGCYLVWLCLLTSVCSANPAAAGAIGSHSAGSYASAKAVGGLSSLHAEEPRAVFCAGVRGSRTGASHSLSCGR